MLSVSLASGFVNGNARDTAFGHSITQNAFFSDFSFSHFVILL